MGEMMCSDLLNSLVSVLLEKQQIHGLTVSFSISINVLFRKDERIYYIFCRGMCITRVYERLTVCINTELKNAT